MAVTMLPVFQREVLAPGLSPPTLEGYIAALHNAEAILRREHEAACKNGVPELSLDASKFYGVRFSARVVGASGGVRVVLVPETYPA